MAGLFQPKITRWIKNGKRVKAHTRGAVQVTETSPTWWACWTDPDTGTEKRCGLSENKSRAIELMQEIEADLVRRRLGLPGPAPRLDTRPLSEHLEEYCGILQAKGDVAGHVDAVKGHCLALFKLLKWEGLKDVRPDGVLEALAGLREDQEAELPEDLEEYTVDEAAAVLEIKPASVRAALRREDRASPTADTGAVILPREWVANMFRKKKRGISVNTSNHYLRSLKSFSTWLADRERLPKDPLAGLSALNAAVDPRRRRRALAAGTFDTLIDVLADAPAVHGLAGPDRLALYLVASSTGFRAHECSTLTPESFQVKTPPYTVTLPASASKRRRDDGLPIRPDLAELLRPYLAEKPHGKPIWPGKWYRKAAVMLRADLARANIPFESGGKVFDFHALRGQLATALAAAGVHPRIAQALLRLSSIGLAMKHYTDAEGLDPAAALDRLPPVRPAATAPPATPPSAP